MHDRTEHSRTAVMQRPAVCPAWCLGGHDQVADFHHMGEHVAVVPGLQPLPAPHEQEVRVLPSAFVGESGELRPPIVELRVGEGTRYTLAELSPEEAVRVADGLTVAAGLAGSSEAAPAPEDAAERHWWQSGPCPSWCGNATSHHAAEAYGDRTCFSGDNGAQRRILLTLDEAFIEKDTFDGSACAATLDVYLRQHYREREPRVTMAVNEKETLDLTLGEARELRQHLDELLAQADRG